MFSPRYWTFILIVLAAFGYSMFRISQSPDLIVSPADAYSYRYMELENGLKVMLVRTPEADKASAALSVNVGSMDDPEGREGLAHFLEHMLFLGTEPFPEPDEYQQFIKQNGGSHNAFTSYAQTTYFFDVDNEQLSGALERFAPFFISPTFNEAYVDREKNAVHAEYSANLKEDGRRIFSAQKMAMNPEFTFSNFSTGNLDTLSDRDDSKIRDELISFYKTHYSSDRMTLVIAGDYELDQLGNKARNLFSDVPKRDVHFERPDVPVFVPEQLPLDMHIKPVKEIRELRFTFPLPEILSQYQHKPVQLLSNLIGHEGDGSILALLKKKGWAESLSAGRSLSTRHASTMVVGIGLTKSGLLHQEEITSILMEYIDLIRTNGIPEYIKEEQKMLNEMTFRFQEHGPISNYTTRLSSNMLIFPVEDTIYGDYRSEPASDELMSKYLSSLTADNMLRVLIAPGVDTDTTDPWYGTEIKIRPSDYRKPETSEWTGALHLPKANPFVPENLETAPGEASDTPELVASENGYQLWYYPEHEFDAPRAQVLISIKVPEIKDSAEQRVLARLYARTVTEALNTYSYPASLAGLNYRLSATSDGLEIAVGGYFDKLPVLLEQIFTEMKNMNISGEEFNRYQASLIRALENNLKARPYQRTLADLKNWIIEPSFSDTDLLPVVKSATKEALEQFAAQLGNTLSVTTYVHGTLSAESAENIGAITQKYYPANTVTDADSRLLKAPAGQYQQAVVQDHPDKVMTLYLQGSDTSDMARAEAGLLAQMISSPYYQYMRTEQQLGYIVFATAYPQKSVPGLLFIVQSPTASPEEMMNHSRIFFRDYEGKLETMSDEEFALFQEGLITRLTEKPKNMGEKAANFWADLSTERYTFDTRQAIADEVVNITKTQILNLYRRAVLNNEWSWLLFEKGGKVNDMTALETLDRSSLEQFELPEYPLPAVNGGHTTEDGGDDQDSAE
ncbi:insulinase family protein [Thalassolituus sp.]|uniref:insulinase family protein n=1 Tax=Thalassolituus sp. TaxID=2030822 RepID=UPI0027D62CDE|nr:insulinase family protein [Thalassolituus sp.]MDQ4426026.1 insulinase family protein [Thalassolituus sp.]